MTVIAWDGKTLAADKRAVSNGCQLTTTKIRFAANGKAMAVAGDTSIQEALMAWYDDGCDRSKIPACQLDKDRWGILVVADPFGCWHYHQEGYAIKVEAAFAAYGSGREYALTAMHLGHSAVQAVEVASQFDVYCGNGVDAIQL